MAQATAPIKCRILAVPWALILKLRVPPLAQPTARHFGPRQPPKTRLLPPCLIRKAPSRMSPVRRRCPPVRRNKACFPIPRTSGMAPLTRQVRMASKRVQRRATAITHRLPQQTELAPRRSKNNSKQEGTWLAPDSRTLLPALPPVAATAARSALGLPPL